MNTKTLILLLEGKVVTFENPRFGPKYCPAKIKELKNGKEKEITERNQ